MTVSHPLDSLIRRLDAHSALNAGDRDAIRSLVLHSQKIAAMTHLICEGEPPRSCPILLNGYAIRHKMTGEGKRQIVAIQIPGEPLDFQSLFLRRADHSIQALTDCEVAMVSRPALKALVADRPGFAAAAMAYNMVEASILREWLINVGRRRAYERLAHFLAEFAYRLDAQGLGSPGGYVLPMSQEQLGDALGLTQVHVNRSLRELEKRGLIARDGRTVTFPNPEALQTAGDFDPGYLHLRG